MEFEISLESCQLQDILDGLELPDRPRTNIEQYLRFYQVDVGGVPGCDQYLYLHPNGVCCLGITKQHSLVNAALAHRKAHGSDSTLQDSSLSIDFGDLANKARCSGKSKSGDFWVPKGLPICKVTVGSHVFEITSIAPRSKLMEVNHRVVETPDLLIDR